MNATTKTRRSIGLEGLKLLMGTGAMAATIGLWSVFAHRDQLTVVSQEETVIPVANEVTLDLPPIPTLVPFNNGSEIMPTSQPFALAPEGLRSVSAPAQPSFNPSTPRVVQGNNGGSSGGGGGGTVTTTRSS